MLRVGLTGGIGSGKSTVAALLAERGAVVIDADRLAREAVAPGTDGLAEVVALFGDGVLDDSGALDRPALGAIVFADPDARARLEAVVHPRVRAAARGMERDASERDPDAVVVHDVPLLVETGQQGEYDVVLVVDTDEEVALTRLRATRGMSDQDARARMAAQATRAQRRAAADVVIDNSGSADALGAQIDAVWRDLRRRAAGLSRSGDVQH